MNTKKSCLSLAVLVTLISGSLVAADAATLTYGGDAYNAEFDLSVLGAPIVSTTENNVGPLAPAGGSLSNTIGGFSVDGFTGGVSTAATQGGTPVGTATSSASVGTISLSEFGIPFLSVTAFSSNSKATTTSVIGGTSVATIDLLGAPIFTTNGTPNQTAVIPGLGTIVADQQINSSAGNLHEITVNGLDISLDIPDPLGGPAIVSGSLILDHSESSVLVTPSAAVPEPGSLAVLTGFCAPALLMLRRKKG